MLNLRKKLLVSIFTLMLALVAVSTTTYAWFTLGNVTDVKGIEMTVQGADGLEIRVEKINHITVSTNEDLKALYNWSTAQDLTSLLTGDYAIALTPLYMNDLTTGALVPIKSIDETIDSGANAVYGTAATLEQKQFIEITFGFKTQSSNNQSVVFKSLKASTVGTHSFETAVALSQVGSLTAASGVVSGAIAANSSLTEVRAANALRVAYYDAKTSKYVVCDPDEYDASTVQCGRWAGTALEYFNAIDQTVYSDSHVKKGQSLDLVAPADYSCVKVKEAETLLVPLTWKAEDLYSYGTLTIRIWLEGWDADCFNAVAFDNVKFDMQFGTKATA